MFYLPSSGSSVIFMLSVELKRGGLGSLLLIHCHCSAATLSWLTRSFFYIGIDSEGHAANFVETEQIVHYKGSKASFVQVKSV